MGFLQRTGSNPAALIRVSSQLKLTRCPVSSTATV
jgi:hypothetical protein